MKRFFITGTGTGVGKTLLTCALAHQLRKAGNSVRAIKPVISGFDPGNIEATDTGLLLEASALPLTAENIETVSPWRFVAALSPHMAAEDEGTEIDLSALLTFCRASSGVDYLLVEGIGGVMVPLNDRETVLDWMAALAFPVLLVAGSRLGSLSHTLTSVQAIISAGLSLHAVVVCEEENSTVPLARTCNTLRRFLPHSTRMVALERLDYCPKLWKYVPGIISEIDF